MIILKPIKYKLSDGYLWVKSGEKQEWVKVRKTNAKIVTPINQRYGKNSVPFYKTLGMEGHNGIDWEAPTNTCLYSPIDGEVIFVRGDNDDGYGEVIVILSEEFDIEGKKRRYSVVEGHLKSQFVRAGDKVKRGQFIGLTNNTGKYTTGPHLHEGFRLLFPMEMGLTKFWYGSNWGYKDNGFKGYINYFKLIDQVDIKIDNTKNMILVKTESSPHVYLISGDGKKKIMLIDYSTLLALSPSHTVITKEELDKYEDGGSIVWVDRIVK